MSTVLRGETAQHAYVHQIKMKRYSTYCSPVQYSKERDAWVIEIDVTEENAKIILQDKHTRAKLISYGKPIVIKTITRNK